MTFLQNHQQLLNGNNQKNRFYYSSFLRFKFVSTNRFWYRLFFWKTICWICQRSCSHCSWHRIWWPWKFEKVLAPYRAVLTFFLILSELCQHYFFKKYASWSNKWLPKSLYRNYTSCGTSFFTFWIYSWDSRKLLLFFQTWHGILLLPQIFLHELC